MCIMEVRPGQHDSTIAQAQAHNLGTVVGDLVMFATLLQSRGREDEAAEVDQLKEAVTRNMEHALDLYSRFIATEVNEEHPEVHHIGAIDSYETLLSTIAAIVERDRNRARHYETRTEATMPADRAVVTHSKLGTVQHHDTMFNDTAWEMFGAENPEAVMPMPHTPPFIG